MPISELLRHDVRLAFLSIRRNPFLTALIVGAIAVGIGMSVATITLYHARAGNPIWWKDNVLFRVMLDSRPADTAIDRSSRHPEYPPFVMIYQDASAVVRSPIPERRVMMYSSNGLLATERPQARPFRVTARVTTADFFAMFDVPFLYGNSWSATDDERSSQTIVIARHVNDRLFGGENSVGRSVSFAGRQFRVVGVLDTWMPQPRFYDASGGFSPADDVFIPFGWAAHDILPTMGLCQQSQSVATTFRELATSECIWLDVWVELPDAARVRSFREFLDNYARAQLERGRFARPLNNRLVNVSTWLKMNDVVGSESRIQVALALVFLMICVLNTLGLMLAKFMSVAAVAGLRRALGATKWDILRQHLVEVIVMGVSAGVMGTALAAVGLRLIRDFFFMRLSGPSDNPQLAMIARSLSQMDGQMILLALGLSLLASILAGVYPAWRIGKLPPASFLKAQ